MHVKGIIENTPYVTEVVLLVLRFTQDQENLLKLER